MNQETFNDIYQNKLTPIQRNVLLLFLKGETREHYHPAGMAHHLRDIAEKFDSSFKVKVKDKDKDKLVFQRSDFRDYLLNLFIKYKPEIVNTQFAKDKGFIIDFPEPGGSDPLSSPFYLERFPIEQNCYKAIKKPGALIRIKAPMQMGKTSLLTRIKNEAKKNNYETVFLDFSLIVDINQLNSEYKFLRNFYMSIVEQLPSAPPLQEWDRSTPSTLKCTRQIKSLLKQLNKVVVLILDEVDKVFPYLEIYPGFLPMLRYWSEQANESEIWKNLRLVLSHSTEDYGRYNIIDSPFENIGATVKLEEFTEEQVRVLVTRHGLDSIYTVPLMSMVGGHPYLVRKALYCLRQESLSIEQLLNEATTNAGIYGKHLRRHLKTLQDNQDLAKIFKQIAASNETVEMKGNTSQQIYQLESMGLIKVNHNIVKARCCLYQEYFRRNL